MLLRQFSKSIIVGILDYKVMRVT